jgi:hypothetical protein
MGFFEEIKSNNLDLAKLLLVLADNSRWNLVQFSHLKGMFEIFFLFPCTLARLYLDLWEGAKSTLVFPVRL